MPAQSLDARRIRHLFALALFAAGGTALLFRVTLKTVGDFGIRAL